MSRFLLALSLSLFAAASVAGTTTAVTCAAVDGGGKPAKPTTVSSSQDCDAAATSQPSAAPARSTAPRTALPRWHSLLPGMIR
ncbi:MAG: hypothetical protein WC213_04390 [Arenimonas sp.]|jgi:hypothetical protein